MLQIYIFVTLFCIASNTKKCYIYNFWKVVESVAKGSCRNVTYITDCGVFLRNKYRRKKKTIVLLGSHQSE